MPTTPPASATKKTPQEDFTAKLARLNRSGAGDDAHGTAGSSEVREGLPFEAFEALAGALALPSAALAAALGTSERTLLRRRERGRLGPAESDRLWRLSHVYRLTLEAFDGDAEQARAWLTKPKQALGGDSPVKHLDTEPGFRLVEQMLAAIEHTLPA